MLSDGSLLAVFGEIPLTVFLTGSGVLTMYATRSTDGGRTWSPAVKVARDLLSNIVDPDHQSTVYEVHCCVFSLAAGPDRSAHLSWSTTHGVNAGDVWVTSTSNAGRTWSAPSDIHRSAQVFQPTLAVSAKAGLALTWYDFTGHTPGANQLLTRLWVARSFDGGTTWTIRRLAGPFDMRTAAPVGAGYLGDFQSLVPVSDGFEAAFTLAEPQAQHGPTDIFAEAVP